MTAAEWEQYAEASSYGDTETCHQLATRAETDRNFFAPRGSQGPAIETIVSTPAETNASHSSLGKD